MASSTLIAENLAAAFLGGTWNMAGLVRRGGQALGRRYRWLRPLARDLLAVFPVPPALEQLARLIEADRRFTDDRNGTRPPLRRLFWPKLVMGPTPWPVPSLPTPAALADWLGLPPTELAWFGDCHRRGAKARAGPLRHYSYCWRPKRGGKWRLLETPKARLKAMQRRLLHEMLDQVPPHDAAHGFRRGRSLTSYVAPHVGKPIVVRFDLRDFFASVRAARVHALFRRLGYPRPVARLLTGLCTHVVPAEVLDATPCPVGQVPSWPAVALYRQPHLPQGAPTSPALANLCAHRLDRRLAGLARKLGGSYTRYADDLAFSGGAELVRCARRLQVHACRIALEEGFEVHTRKSRFMRQAVRQQLAGVVLNVRPNVRREEYDRLKAILHNAARLGPASQNRDGRADFRAHLLGRIAFVEMLNADRGRRLRRCFDRIRWEQQ